MVALAEAVIRADVRVDLVVMLDGDDVDLIFAADIQAGQRLTDPCGLNGKLIDGIVCCQGDEIKDVVRVVAHGELFGDLALRTDDLVCTDLAQEVCLNVLLGLRDDHARAELLEQGRDDERGLEVLADGDEADVEIVDTERLDDGIVRAVTDI